jgi:hypothetical protein
MTNPTTTPFEINERHAEAMIEEYADHYNGPLGEFVPTRTITISALFWQDHLWRDLPSGRLIRLTKNRATIAVNDEHLSEIESDADYYASFDGDDYVDNRSFCDAAKRVLAAIEKQVTA